MSTSHNSRSRWLRPIVVLILVFVVASVSYAQTGSSPDRTDRAVPSGLDALRLESPVTASSSELLQLDSSLLTAEGPQTVVVRLRELPVARVVSRVGITRAVQESQLSRIRAQQNSVIGAARTLDANTRVLGRTTHALNAIMLEVDASALVDLAANSDVASINPIVDYELDLSETVPYIGATAVQQMGFDGAGIRVAVLDSGVDYTHANLGGSGDPADYAANDPSIVEPGSFPTARVVGGYDFVGDQWPAGPLMPDADPIDSGPAAGHGTHVADIIGGMGGVAPATEIYAVKVCSSVSTSCSGLALLQAMDFALDPNGDGDVSDHVDLINMSLGSVYGQAFDDDLSMAVDNASVVGVLTVASAGNSADKPYVTGSPAAAPSALSVAQTSVPSAFQPLMVINEPANIAGEYAAVFQPWAAPLTEVIEAPVQFGDGAGGNIEGCAPFAADSLAGKIVLVDRGGCFFSDKIRNIGDGGGLIGIIGLVTPGDPFEGGFGGGDPITIPGYMISQADANTIKSELDNGVVALFDPNSGIPLVMHMVGSSSRGPTMLTNIIKPEIGAPGASISAVAGTGTGVEAFGGTSGAAPMVTGSAALLLNAFPERAPHEVKAVLMNTAETEIMNRPAFFGGGLAPITRIGGGEVRVDRALASPAAAWDAKSLSGALSFSFHDVARSSMTSRRQVVITNYSNNDITYNIAHSFRFEDDAVNGAVELHLPEQVVVPANGQARFVVSLTVRGVPLREWALNSGLNGANADLLSLFEYDGYIHLTEADNPDNALHLAWHVLPRQAGDVTVERGREVNRVQNNGVGTTTVESYSLIGKSANMHEGGLGQQDPRPDFRYLGYATFPVPAGFCSADESFLMAFAVNTWERQTHANAPASFEFYLDTNQDGTADYLVLNRDLTLNSLSDGRNVAWVANLSTGLANAFFFTDHETNSGNTVLYFCGEQIGMNAEDFFTPIDVTAIVRDIYFTGTASDMLTGITISPLGEQYLGVFENGGVGATTLGRRGWDRLQILDFGLGTNNTETGLLLLYRNGAPADNEVGIIEP